MPLTIYANARCPACNNAKAALSTYKPKIVNCEASPDNWNACVQAGVKFFPTIVGDANKKVEGWDATGAAQATRYLGLL
eukprot:NODE_5203_length_421_cov_112.182796_g4529_i0.p1 GENE.NODE_5203_length_421_cov_112.182796_g4529_i0~~NODE_5203_length_421_cov_112.182796_g4529_i0.p1  ORF type:complete len:79 (-),score=20.88 NODE_5203_length_421_cov_112.182796_g4529_i0:125-361(-)